MIRRKLVVAGAVCGMFLAGVQFARAQSDVTQPSDLITGSSENAPGSEGVANAIDNGPSKYLNFDGANDAVPTGFVVTPGVGLTRVIGLSMTSANDAPDRDPRVVLLEGSNSEVAPAWDDTGWELITMLDAIPSWPSVFGPTDAEHRGQTQSFFFENLTPYRHYRWVVVNTQGTDGTPTTCCMQIREVELLGSVVPADVTQPGDLITGSSENAPGSEGVANAIDNGPSKYLNFDGANDAVPTGFVVSPAIGNTLVTGLSMTSANDAPDRDPRVVRLEGSNAAAAPAWDDAAAWELIYENAVIPSWPSVFGPTDAEHRGQTQTFLFDNYVPYAHYRWVVVNTQGTDGTPTTCCMQIREVELLGTGAPVDVTQPSDMIAGSSENAPGSEGVANAIDNGPSKYLNFDGANDAVPTGFVVTPAVGATTIIGLSMTSANDAPDRDPRVVLVEGSNAEVQPAWDDPSAWELIAQLDAVPSWPSVFGPTDAEHRGQTQEFYFPNNRSYLHYRWVVVNTQGTDGTPTTCCMQIREVELLAVTAQADCEKAAFVQQPQNTPVLSGESATLFTVVNGPWPLQWYKNGVAIPGATQLTYTTDPVTAANEADQYTVEIVGCVTSNPVQATVFTPDSFKSVGVNFRGAGANGAPTDMLNTDVAGVQLQAYWNNATGATLATPLTLVDSDNQASAVTVTFASSGEWGSGTGDLSPRQRMLNGLIHAAPGTPGTVTFSGVPAGEHDVIVYTVGIPRQFQSQDYTIVGQTSRTIYTSQMNSDQFNPNPIFIRGNSGDPGLRTLANYVRFQKVQAAGDGTIILNWSTDTTGFDRGVAVNGIQLVLNAPDIPEPPQLVILPQPTETLAGAAVTLSVDAIGEGLTYQWRRSGIPLSDDGRVNGATGPELTIRSFGPADEGFYNVVVENAGGSAVTDSVKVKIVDAGRTIEDDLIVHLKMDETSGTTISNTGTDGINGEMLLGAPSWDAGKIGNAYEEITGTDGVLIPDFTKIQDEVTVSAWVRLTGIGETDYVIIRNGNGALLTAASGSNFPVGQFELGLDLVSASVMNLRAQITTGVNVTTVRETSEFPLDEWQHVAFTADGRQLRLYRNGELVGTTTYLDSINQPNLADYLSVGVRMATDAGGTIGTDPGTPPDAGPQAFFGQIDDVGMWLTAWPASVIQSIYEQGNAAQDLTTAALPVLPEPSEDITLTVGVEGGNVTISWAPEGGTLEMSTDIGGTWSPVAGNPNPYTVAAPTGNAYFRVNTE